MVFAIINLLVLAFAALVSWWLSGFDAKLTGHDEKPDRWRRFIRCGITLLLVEVAFWNLWLYDRYSDVAAGAVYLAIAMFLGLTWVGCVSGMLAHGFSWLFDPQDHRELDSKKVQRDLDAINLLIKSGNKEGAIQLCRQLKESGDASVLAMDTMLEHLGVPQSSATRPNPLAEGSRLRLQGRFMEAESILKPLLAQNPANVDAAMLLIRLFAQDLRRTDLAMAVLTALEQQPYVLRDHVEFARHSLAEWGRRKASAIKTEVLTNDIDELLAQRRFGTALEILEHQTSECPEDFDAWLKIAEVQAVHCGHLNRAEKIIWQLEAEVAFRPDQIQLAKVKLKEWREASTSNQSPIH